MPKNPRKDFTQSALSIVEQATGQAPIPKKTPKQEASSKGGKAGGKARAAMLSPKKRKEIAKKAANARWGDKDPTEQQPAAGAKSSRAPARAKIPSPDA